MKKVLLLGGTGRLGLGFIQEYFEKYKSFYDLIIGYHKTKPECELESRRVDINDMNILKEAMKGVDVVVDLAANSDQNAEFEKILQPNIVGAYNVFEAAQESKVKRVIFASSVHAIKGYNIDYLVKHHDIPKPLNFYGASKTFGEALCNVYSTKYDMSCLAIRIGAYTSNDEKKVVCFMRENYHYVITQRDMAQLIHKCIVAPKEVHFGILSGISNNKKKNMDLEFTKGLVGYEPEDDMFEICEKIKKRENAK